MADDTSQTGNDNIGTDHVTTLNGQAVVQSSSSPKIQRVKVGFGDDGTHRDASSTYPLPVFQSDRGLRVGMATSGRSTVTAAADGALVGRMWLINPVGSTALLAIRRVEFSSAPTAATAFISSPRVTCERVTFTGTASGASITPAVRDTNENVLVGSVRTASTGLTLTAGAVLYAFTVAPILTAVGAHVPVLQEFEPASDGRLILRAGQGMVIRQADAGTASDTRSFQVNLAWEEF